MRNDLSGRRFGRLTAVRRIGTASNRVAIWEAVCDCGNVTSTKSAYLVSGETKSCGCLKRELAVAMGSSSKTHGHARDGARSSTYAIWSTMKARCMNPASADFQRYGGRGITVCARWAESFENFLQDMGERPEGKSLDRIDGNGNYEPSNCRWATNKEQARNHSLNRIVTVDGESKCVAEWSDLSGVKRAAIYRRLASGWEPSRAVFTAVAKRPEVQK